MGNCAAKAACAIAASGSTMEVLVWMHMVRVIAVSRPMARLDV